MALDPGGARFGGPYSVSLGRGPRPTGRIAPGITSGPSALERVTGGFLSALNPISAGQRVIDQYRDSNERMAAYRQMSETQRAKFNASMFEASKPSGVIEGLGLPHPHSAKDLGALLAMLIPVRGPRGPEMVDVNTYRGGLSPKKMHEEIPWEEFNNVLEGGAPFLDFQGLSNRLLFSDEHATTALADRPVSSAYPTHRPKDVSREERRDPIFDRIVGSARWLGGTHDYPNMHLSDIYVHPDYRGNLNLFQALSKDMLAQGMQSSKPLEATFANVPLMRLADRFFSREGWKPEKAGTSGQSRLYYPPGYRPGIWSYPLQ